MVLHQLSLELVLKLLDIFDTLWHFIWCFCSHDSCFVGCLGDI